MKYINPSPNNNNNNNKCHHCQSLSISFRYQVMATLATSMCMVDIGALIAFGSVSLPRITDPDSEDLVFDTDQAAFFGS